MLEDGSGNHCDLLEVIRIGPNRVKIETQAAKYDLVHKGRLLTNMKHAAFMDTVLNAR